MKNKYPEPTSSDKFHAGRFYTVGARFMMCGLPMEAADIWKVAHLPRSTMDRFAADDL